MPSPFIHSANKTLPHFLTLTVVHWYYLFDRHHRWHILQEALSYRIQHHQLKLYAFVFMLNHIHLVVSSSDLISFVRDFKKFTTYQFKQNITRTEPNLLQILVDEQGNFQLWQRTNMPIVLESQKVIDQKISYIHFNPVKKMYVTNPEAWYWSSANPNCPLKPESL